MARAAKNRELNLLLALDRSKDKAGGGSSTRLIVLLIIVVVLASSAAAVYYFLTTSNLKDQKDSSFVYLNDPAVQAAYDESGRAQAEAARMQGEATELSGAIANLKTYPKMSSSNWKKLFRIAGGRVDVSGFSYDQTTGLLTFSATTTSATRVPIFIAELRTSGIFSDVTYEGYSGGTTSTTVEEEIPGDPIIEEDGSQTPTTTTTTVTVTTKSYSFNVSCLVKPPKAKK